MKITAIKQNFYTPTFKANYSKENNVAILGSSKATSSILDDMDKCSEITKQLVLSGKNIITGCGSKGIMGSVYYTAAKYSTKDENGAPEQNVVILKRPFWGDEDFKNCQIFGSEKTEAARIERFIETADTFIIFAGGPGTIQEASTIISNNYYNKENAKKVILVGSDYFKGLNEQYWNMYDCGLINRSPEELYTIVDEVDEALIETK
ncbi:MAG: LOG family protein [Candidatus Gastranaerophilales bacterium]|nr:LOG family protein [Candidatus Gastranaerophilales bacterium]